MYVFLHNPRCSKSREALKIMEQSGIKYELREYLKNPLSLDELLDLKDKLGSKALDFTRHHENEFKDQGLSAHSSDGEILEKMSHFPKLMQRPIVFDNKKAIIGRPPEDVVKIFKK